MRKKLLFITLFFLLLSVGILTYFIMPIKSKHNLKIPSSNRDEVIEYLQGKGIDVGFLDRVFLSFTTKPLKGWIYLSKSRLPRYKFLLLLGKKSIHYTPVTIVPGETTYFVLNLLEKKLNFNRSALEKIYKKLARFQEGNFLADTYNIPAYFDAQKTIQFLIEKSFKKYKMLSMTYFNEYDPKKWKKIIIIASIIEKEAANSKEMPLVASVIFNRLRKKMRLQMDGTLNYGAYSHTRVTPQRIKSDKTFYNTYKHKGLPKEPVCNVSVNAIKAAIEPAKTNYLYFMKNKNGYHDFTVSYKKHIKNVQKRRLEKKK